jgi:histidinol-phosphate aminotransferase
MSISLTRRQWLLQTGAAAAGLALGRSSAPADFVLLSRPLADGEVRARLNSNENPYGPSERARHAMIEAFDEGCRYPWLQYKALEELIAKREGVSPDHVVLGAGSHEILRLAGTAYGLHGGEALIPHPTFEGLENYAASVGAYVHRAPLTENFELDLEAMDRRITQAVRLVFVCNPNNPTGTIVAGDRLRDFCQAVARRAVVLVDEAYHDYVEAPVYSSMIDLVRQGHTVIVSRTFSKIHGLAGLRIGYGLARPDIASRLRQFRTAHSVNILGLRAALASYQDMEFQAFSRRKNAEARSYLYRVLDELGYRYLSSHTNFVFFRIGRDAQAFREAMEKRGVLVGRPFPPYPDWCRVSLGTVDEMKIFATALREVTRHSPS